MKALKNIFKFFPESILQNKIGKIYRSHSLKPLKFELSAVPIVESGIDGSDRTPFAVLQDGTTLFGMYPSTFQKTLYFEWKHYIPQTISADTIGVAVDIVTRYLYPHAMPHLTMPYSRRRRKTAFHPQHVETISDLPILAPKEKNMLKHLFTPKPGETVLDLGAYMGYGTVRMAKALGGGRVVAVEADPENLRLLRRNIECNRLSNVSVVPKAVWDREDVLSFHKSERQANSLVPEGIISSRSTVSVETTTVDKILSDLGISEVNILSVTLNGAEVEAIKGMKKLLVNSKSIRISLAGWYKRNGILICEMVEPTLLQWGFNVAVGREGGVIAWKGDAS
jgi:FkbM family methyltransferase